MDNRYTIINNKLEQLSKSKFRSSFHLRKYMIEYIDEKGMNKVRSHIIDFVELKLAPPNPKKDGAQTPTRGHPAFIAMHACACCCRSCLEKWHHIEKGRELTQNEKNYIIILLMAWIKKEYKNNKDI